MTITIDGNGTITGASTLATTVASPTLTTPNINSAQFATVTGTAPIYPCRAWVNFNGTGTVAIRASGNVTSITDNGVGDYTVNFTTAMPDANYAVVATTEPSGTTPVTCTINGSNNSGLSASGARILLSYANIAGGNYPAIDRGMISVSIFR